VRMIKTSLFRPATCGLIRENSATILHTILIRRAAWNRPDSAAGIPRLYDEFRIGKVSFPAQLSVK